MFKFLNKKEAALDSMGELFDKAVVEYMSMIIGGLSSTDSNSRKEIAELLLGKVSESLSDDPRPERRKDSALLLRVLSSELRPPENAHEINDLKNAVFWFVKRELRELMGDSR